jgi:hypothetical protein
MLFDPRAHEPLVDRAWDVDAIRAAIAEIAAETEAAFDDGWPAHPLDEPEPHRFRTPYLGGAGVIRALHDLERSDLVQLQHDYIPYLDRPYEPDFPENDHAHSLLMGETGIRLELQRLAPSEANLERLAALIHENRDNPSRELMWGSPGTMLAATELDLNDLWRESADWLESEWDPENGVWTQDLYGEKVPYLGPAHGFAGCMLALAPGDVDGRAVATMRRFAVEEDGLANWPAVAGSDLRSQGDDWIRTQWCHGAPGMVASLASFAPDDREHERLLRAGGELTWRAGPLAKGAGICHGTAGNGYAFLALLKRTGDELWLDRARAFAMHAAAQVGRDRAHYGRGRFTLWTGDLGAALYLADCLGGHGSVPLP